MATVTRSPKSFKPVSGSCRWIGPAMVVGYRPGRLAITKGDVVTVYTTEGRLIYSGLASCDDWSGARVLINKRDNYLDSHRAWRWAAMSRVRFSSLSTAVHGQSRRRPPAVHDGDLFHFIFEQLDAIDS